MQIYTGFHAQNDPPHFLLMNLSYDSYLETSNRRFIVYLYLSFAETFSYVFFYLSLSLSLSGRFSPSLSNVGLIASLCFTAAAPTSLSRFYRQVWAHFETSLAAGVIRNLLNWRQISAQCCLAVQACWYLKTCRASFENNFCWQPNLEQWQISSEGPTCIIESRQHTHPNIFNCITEDACGPCAGAGALVEGH